MSPSRMAEELATCGIYGPGLVHPVWDVVNAWGSSFLFGTLLGVVGSRPGGRTLVAFGRVHVS